MSPLAFTVRGPLRKYPGPGGWYFVEVGMEESRLIRGFGEAKKVGWGYVKVRASIGDIVWDTTLFPTKAGAYLLAVKADVRKKNMLHDGDHVRVECELM